jgi:hypothetical protein
MFFSTAAVLSTLASLAAAQTVHTVDVGLNNLTFTPDNVNAVPGDTVMFIFHAKNQCVPTLALRSAADAPQLSDAVDVPQAVHAQGRRREHGLHAVQRLRPLDERLVPRQQLLRDRVDGRLVLLRAPLALVRITAAC